MLKKKESVQLRISISGTFFPEIFIFCGHMQTLTKYAWDITAERRFTDRQLELIDEISYTISQGGDISEMKKKLHQLKLIKKN
jgi:hypothetical protein